MKFIFNISHFIAVIIIFFLFNCIQARDELNPIALASLLGDLDEGAPGSIGLDLRINNRQWSRGCETRMGNLAANAYAWKTNSDIGLMGGGALRDSEGVNVIPKGTIPTVTLFKQFIIFANQLTRVRIRAYRFKQAMEMSNNVLNNIGDRNTDNLDIDGPQTGNCWLTGSPGGSGRFLHLSNRMSIEVNPTATAASVSGTSGDGNITFTNPGSRVVKIIFNGIILYSNPTGNINTNPDGQAGVPGWNRLPGENCVVNGINFSNSAACRFITIGVDEFQQRGGDSNPAFSPVFPGNNDGSVFLEAINLGDDAQSIHEYIETVYTQGPVFPRISSRIIMP
ncbi:MAG: 5'-nucleotidase C-terminal domain-containing protein [Leptospira sp.]|nr:5'-nucleotidase C-terminal domain-containing protein [Leptospira sp.]